MKYKMNTLLKRFNFNQRKIDQILSTITKTQLHCKNIYPLLLRVKNMLI